MKRGKFIRKAFTRYCDHCHKPYEAKGKDSKFCTRACRQAAYRVRKAAARGQA